MVWACTGTRPQSGTVGSTALTWQAMRQWKGAQNTANKHKAASASICQDGKTQENVQIEASTRTTYSKCSPSRTSSIYSVQRSLNQKNSRPPSSDLPLSTLTNYQARLAVITNWQVQYSIKYTCGMLPGNHSFQAELD